MDFLRFALREKRVLSFGLSFTFLSSFGQTFLVSLFVPDFLNVFALSNARFGLLYSLATLLSAGGLSYIGALIDRSSLKLYSMGVVLGLLAGCITLASSRTVWMLFVGLIMIRLAGQGLSTHTAQTAMAKHYEQARGKALSITSLGLPVGEGFLPLAVTAILGVLSWRLTWVAVALLVGVIFVPLLWYVLETSDLHTDREAGDGGNGSPGSTDPPGTGETYGRLVREPRFWLLAPAVVLPGFWLTGLFLYQAHLADSVGWTLQLLATGFVAYAVVRVVVSLAIGPAIDRWTARRLFPLYLIPMGIGFVFAYLHPGRWAAFPYMGLLGMTMGMGSNIRPALWAELYGQKIVGTVRSIFTSMMVFSTSLSPFFMGWLIDRDIAMETLLAGALVTVVLGTAGATLGLRIGRTNQEP